jgi:hypothetical protein
MLTYADGCFLLCTTCGSLLACLQRKVGGRAGGSRGRARGRERGSMTMGWARRRVEQVGERKREVGERKREVGERKREVGERKRDCGCASAFYDGVSCMCVCVRV